MRKHKIKIFIIGFILSFALVIPSAFSQYGPPDSSGQQMQSSGQDGQFRGKGRKGQKGQQMKKIMEQLDLTDEQKTQITELREKCMASQKETQDALKEAHKSFRQAMDNISSTDEDLKKMHASVEELKAKLSTARFEQALQIRAVLTDEQKTKFNELQKSMRGKRGKRGQRGQGMKRNINNNNVFDVQ